MKPSEIVNAYLTAYTSGDIDRAASLVSEDFAFHVEADGAATLLLVSEWNNVRSGQVASSLMVFDTGRLRGADLPSATVIDPVCGMTIDAATAAPHRRHGQRDYYFCAENCAEAFDANPEHQLAPGSP